MKPPEICLCEFYGYIGLFFFYGKKKKLIPFFYRVYNTTYLAFTLFFFSFFFLSMVIDIVFLAMGIERQVGHWGLMASHPGIPVYLTSSWTVRDPVSKNKK